MATKEKIFMSLPHYHPRTIETLEHYWDPNKTKLIITQLSSAKDNAIFVRHANEHIIPKCRDRKFEAEIVTCESNHYDDKMLELFREHDMKILVTASERNRNILGFFRKYREISCMIWSFDDSGEREIKKPTLRGYGPDYDELKAEDYMKMAEKGIPQSAKTEEAEELPLKNEHELNDMDDFVKNEEENAMEDIVENQQKETISLHHVEKEKSNMMLQEVKEESRNLQEQRDNALNEAEKSYNEMSQATESSPNVAGSRKMVTMEEVEEMMRKRDEDINRKIAKEVSRQLAMQQGAHSVASSQGVNRALPDEVVDLGSH